LIQVEQLHQVELLDLVERSLLWTRYRRRVTLEVEQREGAPPVWC
jgi:hypothetical protein